MIRSDGRAITYPSSLYDGQRVYLSSSTLFSRKLEHIRANPRVALSISGSVSVGGRGDRGHHPGRRARHR